MFLVNFIFDVSYLKIYPALLQMLWKLWRHCSQEETFIKSLLAFVILVLTRVKKDAMIAQRRDA